MLYRKFRTKEFQAEASFCLCSVLLVWTKESCHWTEQRQKDASGRCCQKYYPWWKGYSGPAITHSQWLHRFDWSLPLIGQIKNGMWQTPYWFLSAWNSFVRKPAQNNAIISTIEQLQSFKFPVLIIYYEGYVSRHFPWIKCARTGENGTFCGSV